MDIYIILCLIVLILIGVVALILQMISPILGILGVVIGPLVGAFVGVILGFQINDNNRRKLEKNGDYFLRICLCMRQKNQLNLYLARYN
jgi:hypothetical protein